MVSESLVGWLVLPDTPLLHATSYTSRAPSLSSSRIPPLLLHQVTTLSSILYPFPSTNTTVTPSFPSSSYVHHHSNRSRLFPPSHCLLQWCISHPFLSFITLPPSAIHRHTSQLLPSLTHDASYTTIPMKNKAEHRALKVLVSLTTGPVYPLPPSHCLLHHRTNYPY